MYYKHFILFLFISLCCILPGFSQTTENQKTILIKGIDVYGTSQISAVQVREKFENNIREIIEAEEKQDWENFEKLKKTLRENIGKMGDFAYADIADIKYYSEGHPVYVTIDVVENKDKESRTRFLPTPVGDYPDPDGLLALWEEYEKVGGQLLGKGELDYNFQVDPCPAFHCLWGFEHPQLKKYEELFRLGVEKNQASLIQILQNDKNPVKRGRAAFLLGHLKDSKTLVNALLPLMRDSHLYTRNNVMRVLGFAVMRHQGIDIPLNEVISAINFPSTTDRNKALYILKPLAERPQNKELIKKQAGKLLLALLRLDQPNNHDPAYETLKNISGKTYSGRDYTAWETWLNRME